ncbi:MAG: Lacal_2735 family protein [Ekhidna sp.]|nr:Lacal_2735 family protein [Ekhidna sp.]
MSNKKHSIAVILNMGLFGKKSEKEKLHKQYKKLMKESFELSKTNRNASDRKAAEANEIAKKIEALE